MAASFKKKKLTVFRSDMDQELKNMSDIKLNIVDNCLYWL